jgi:tRNA(Ile)-lysidine synthase
MTEQPLFNSFQEFIHNHHLIERGEKILVCVSGGIDSMALLDLMFKLKKHWKLDIAVVHFNHQLRGIESDGDEAFVRAAAQELGLECYVESADTNQIAETEKISIQEAARDIRYSFFMKLRRSLGYQKIATAHNANDNTETIIMNLLRGSGIHGLTGIPIIRKDQLIIRPLLFATREIIGQYASAHSIECREDSSNLKNDYTRNFLRHKLIPLMQENINPNLTAALGRTSELFTELEDYINNEVNKILNHVVEDRIDKSTTINLPRFHEQPIFIQEHLLLHLGREFSGSEIDFNTVKTMMNISHSDTGSSCSISGDAILYRDRDRLIFKKLSSVRDFSYSIELNKRYEFETFVFQSSYVVRTELSNDPNVEFVDAAKLGKQFEIRSWRKGDWFIPLGMEDQKKVSDFFIDQKIPLFEKLSIPILISDENIIWICGKRLDNRYKITPKTKNIIQLTYIPNNRSSK